MKVKIWITKHWKDSDFLFYIERTNCPKCPIIDVAEIKRDQKEYQKQRGQGYSGAADLETDAEFTERAMRQFDRYVEESKAKHRPDPEIIKQVEFE